MLGACLGSFVTAASYRLPRGKDIVFDKSRCPKCKKVLEARDLIPILSWFINKKKCRKCKKKVSPRYVVTEVIMALISVGLMYRYGIGVEYIIFLLLATCLMVTIIADLETYIMPDSMTIAAFMLGIFHIYYKGTGWEENALGFGLSLLLALALRYGYQLLRKKEGLGMGDVKFLPVAGMWIGASMIPFYLILSGILGIFTALIWKWLFKNPVFPFGPALAVAMFLICVFKATVGNFIPV